MRLLARLDAHGTDDQFRKPRHGHCPLCRRPVIDHPCIAHRRAALVDILGLSVYVGVVLLFALIFAVLIAAALA